MYKRLIHRIKVFMSQQMIACDEASYLLSLREDVRLSFMQNLHLQMHLVSCHFCRKYAKQISQLSQAATRYRSASSNPRYMHHLDQEEGAKIREALNEELKGQ